MIAVSKNGDIAMPYNSAMMLRAAADSNGFSPHSCLCCTLCLTAVLASGLSLVKIWE